MELLTVICFVNTMILTAIATVATINLLNKWETMKLIDVFSDGKRITFTYSNGRDTLVITKKTRTN